MHAQPRSDTRALSLAMIHRKTGYRLIYKVFGSQIWTHTLYGVQSSHKHLHILGVGLLHTHVTDQLDGQT